MEIKETLSGDIEKLRDALCNARSLASKMRYKHKIFSQQLEDFEGLLTVGIRAGASLKRDVVEWEDKCFEEKEGKSYAFTSRGIGYESCNGCFVCGCRSEAHNNIAAYVKSREEASDIVEWFNYFAKIDWRGTWGYVKVAVCDQHIPYLQQLHDLTSNRNFRIRKSYIDDILNDFGQSNKNQTT